MTETRPPLPVSDRVRLTCPHPDPDGLIVSHRGYVVHVCLACLIAYCRGEEIRAGQPGLPWASVSQDGVFPDLD